MNILILNCQVVILLWYDFFNATLDEIDQLVYLFTLFDNGKFIFAFFL